MKFGYYKGNLVKIYEDGDSYILEFNNGTSITVSDLSEVVCN